MPRHRSAPHAQAKALEVPGVAVVVLHQLLADLDVAARPTLMLSNCKRPVELGRAGMIDVLALVPGDDHAVLVVEIAVDVHLPLLRRVHPHVDVERQLHVDFIGEPKDLAPAKRPLDEQAETLCVLRTKTSG